MKIKKDKFGLGDLWTERRLVFLAEKEGGEGAKVIKVDFQSKERKDVATDDAEQTENTPETAQTEVAVDNLDVTAIRATDSEATKAILGISDKWFRNIRTKSIAPTFKQEVIRVIDKENENAAKFGENLLRGVQSTVGFTGEKAMKEMERLMTREESAKTVIEDTNRHLQEIQQKKSAVQNLAKKVPAWRPILKAEAMIEQVREPVGNIVGSALRIGKQESMIKKINKTAQQVAADANVKIQQTEARFQEKIQSDKEKRTTIFNALKLDDNPANNKLLDDIAASGLGDNIYALQSFMLYGQGRDSVAAHDFIKSLKGASKADQRAVFLLLKSMRSSALGEATVADFNQAVDKAKERAEKRREKERAERAQKRLIAFLKQERRKLNAGAEIELAFAERTGLKGKWMIEKSSGNVIKLKQNGKSNTIEIKPDDDKNLAIIFGKNNIADDLTDIKKSA